MEAERFIIGEEFSDDAGTHVPVMAVVDGHVVWEGFLADTEEEARAYVDLVS